MANHKGKRGDNRTRRRPEGSTDSPRLRVSVSPRPLRAVSPRPLRAVPPRLRGLSSRPAPRAFVSQFGESFIGEGVNAAHINTVLGGKGGAVEQAWVAALAQPSPG